jgi:hypothetical protein
VTVKGAGLYVLGIIGLSAVAVAGMVAAEVLRPNDLNTALTGQILGIVTPTIAALVVLIKSAANAQALEEVKQKQDVADDKLDANTHLTAAGAEFAKVAARAVAGQAAVSEVETHGPQPYRPVPLRCERLIKGEQCALQAGHTKANTCGVAGTEP